MPLEIKPWRFDPLEYEECLAYLQQGKSDRLIVPRSLPELDRLVDHICFLRGSYLVTGYRGVGKTSFVNYALALANQRLKSLDPPGVLVRVPLSLARNYGIEKLLRRAIRRLYEALIETEVELPIDNGEKRRSLFSLLPDDLQAELTVAYQKTSAKVSEAATEALKTVIATATTGEFKIGGEAEGEATMLPDPLPARLGVKLSGGYKRSKTASRTEETARETMDSLEYLEYDDEIAEADLIRLIKRLAGAPISLRYQEIQPVPRKCSWFWRMWGRIRHCDYLQRVTEREEVRSLHLVFVFDELDKVDPDDAEGMLRSLKGLLMTSDATFIFIGGWEFANKWLSRTQPEGDLLYSLFADVIYVPLYTDDELNRLADELIAASPQNDEDLRNLLEHTKLHCMGTPREFFRQLLRFVRWAEGKPILEVHQEEGLFHHLFPHVHKVNSQIPKTLPSEVRDALVRCTDQWLMVAEREAVFSFEALFDRGRTDTEGGLWQQVLAEHYDRFFSAMLEVGVFQLLEEGTEERYRFNQNFSLGTWVRRVPASPVLEEPKEPVPPSGPFEPPPELAYFVNREAELRAIRQALDAGVPLIQIVGMGGVGKTALAVKVAHGMRGRFPDGVLWIALEPGITLKNVLHHIALSYGNVLADTEAEALAAQIRSLLASKKALIVLDSAENLSENELKQLIPGTRSCPVIITTRARFSELERLGQTIFLDVLPRKHSLSLLRRAAGYQRVSSAEKVALEICELLGDHPLAIEIAGRLARSRGWNMQSLLGNLQVSTLELPGADTPGSSIPRAFAASYESLTDEQKRALMAASIFEGDFDVEGAARLLSTRDKGIVENLLDSLVNRSLVSRSGGQTYRVHPLIRAYTRSVAEDSELEKMRHRHARYFLKWVRTVRGEAK